MDHKIILLLVAIFSFYSLPIIINIIYYLPWLWASYDMYVKYMTNKEKVDEYLDEYIPKLKCIIEKMTLSDNK